jgi:class 3 adenylate cyclase
MEERGLKHDGTPLTVDTIPAPPPVNDVFAFENDTASFTIPPPPGGNAISRNNGGTDFRLDSEDIRFGQSISFLFRLLLVSFVLGFAWHYPFKRMLRRKRKGKVLSAELLSFCRRWLIYTPLINSVILGLGFAVSLISMGYHMINMNELSDISQQFYTQFFYISLIASLLSVLFVYFWQKHRVNFKYLDHVFDSVSLYKASKYKNSSRIKFRLWVSSAMTTLLPLSIVVFYMFLSITAVKQASNGPLSPEQVEVIFGKYLGFIEVANLHDSSSKLFYVNAIDSLLMFVGIFTGILISIFYLFYFVSWTTKGIAIPLTEVLEKMKESGEGKLGRLAIVRTNDEFGQLATGFNEMAVRISRNIDELKEITLANQRFVPDEFLQLMGKDSITEVNLGDQVQKFMTVLFVDIRSFTSLSERMSPRENFNFLNTYLGYMEPVIRQHRGFIDKFVGDSIMALFEQKAEDAIDAAIAMRQKLKEFNQLMEQTGRMTVDTGAGLHAGNLMLGVVGGEGRMETTVISDAVNLASRLEGLTREYDSAILVSESTLKLIEDKDKYVHRFIDTVLVRGRQETVNIFEIFVPDESCPSENYLRMYDLALEYCRNKKHQEAKDIFNRLLLERPQDTIVKKYKKLCE